MSPQAGCGSFQSISNLLLLSLLLSSATVTHVTPTGVGESLQMRQGRKTNMNALIFLAKTLSPTK